MGACLGMKVHFDSHHGRDQDADGISVPVLSSQVQDGAADPVFDGHICSSINQLRDDLYADDGQGPCTGSMQGCMASAPYDMPSLEHCRLTQHLMPRRSQGHQPDSPQHALLTQPTAEASSRSCQPRARPLPAQAAAW